MKGSTTYSFRMLKEADEWSELTPHESELMGALFEGGFRRKVDLDDLEHEFYKHLKAIKNGIIGRPMHLGYYHHRPDKVRSAYTGGGLAMSVFLLLGVGFFGENFDFFYFPLGAGVMAAALTAVPIIGFGLVMPARTVKGARQLEHILGFQEFLHRVEADHFRRMIDSPEMFERYLPHAMALQVEKQWLGRLRTCTRNPPTGIQGQKGGDSDRPSS